MFRFFITNSVIFFATYFPFAFQRSLMWYRFCGTTDTQIYLKEQRQNIDFSYALFFKLVFTYLVIVVSVSSIFAAKNQLDTLLFSQKGDFWLKTTFFPPLSAQQLHKTTIHPSPFFVISSLNCQMSLAYTLFLIDVTS